MFSHLRYWTSSNPGTEFSPFAITLTLFDFGLVRVYYLIQYCSSVSHFVYIREILWNSVLFTKTISILYRIFLQVLNFHLILFLMDTPFFLFLVTEKSSFYISIMDKKILLRIIPASLLPRYGSVQTAALPDLGLGPASKISCCSWFRSPTYCQYRDVHFNTYKGLDNERIYIHHFRCLSTQKIDIYILIHIISAQSNIKDVNVIINTKRRFKNHKLYIQYL